MSNDSTSSSGVDGAAVPNGNQPSSNNPELDFVPASEHDLFIGNTIYVRGRKAVLTRHYDFPHVYWRFNDESAQAESEATGFEPIEKHRSFLCNPEIFQVLRSEKRDGGKEDDGDMPDLTSDEDEEYEEEQARQRLQQVYGVGGQHSTDNTPPETPLPSSTDDESATEATSDGEDVTPPQASHAAKAAAQVEEPTSSAVAAESAAPTPFQGNTFMNMFTRRPEKSIFTNVTDVTDEVINARMPQSVAIESSARSHFRVPNKVTSITLLNCEDVTLEFLSAISSVELIRCRRCTIRCTQQCSTFTLDESEANSVHFPAFQSRVMFVTTNSNGTNLVAVPGGALPPTDGESEEKMNEIENEVTFVIREPESAPVEGAEVSPSPAPTPSQPTIDLTASNESTGASSSSSSSSSSAPKQLRTTWSNATASFATEVLQRQGMLGYFSNNQ